MFNTKKPVGNGINAPIKGGSEASKTMNVSLSSNGGLETTASSENLSAKFKYPKVSQEIPQAGKNQYE